MPTKRRRNRPPVTSDETPLEKQEKGAANAGAGDDNTSPKTSSAQEQDMQPFDAVVFNAQRTAWEKENPASYYFSQEHSGQRQRLIVSGGMWVEDNISLSSFKEGIPPGKEVPLLICDTISELYEKINAVWTEQRYTADSFLIKYNDKLHYPENIQIKNFYDNGYDYTAEIWVLDGEEVFIGPKPWGDDGKD